MKKAYRDLVRKYHPDKYVDNPLADVASEKMKEINAAYDQIQKDRKAGRTSYGNTGYGNGGYNYGQYGTGNASYGNYGSGYSKNSQFSDVRRLIQQNRIAEAEEILDGVPDYNRNAEWYFLKGAYITAGVGLGKRPDASSGHIRWNREIRNMPRHISAWHTSSNTVLPREEPPAPSSTAVPVIAVIAAQRLCVWTASATVFAATAAVKN